MYSKQRTEAGAYNKDFGAVLEIDLTRSLVSSVAQSTLTVAKVKIHKKLQISFCKILEITSPSVAINFSFCNFPL